MLEPAPFPVIADVFIDGFSSGMDFQAFGNSKVDALDVDTEVKYKGTRALKITVPSVGDPSGWFAGGVFATSTPRDFSEFDALTFWARASAPANLDLVGFGDDNSGQSPFRASRSNLRLTTSWQQFILPIPDPSKLTQERGLLFFSDGADNEAGYDVWFDEVKFEKLGTVANPIFELEDAIALEGGETHSIGEMTMVFDVNGIPSPVTAGPAYFSFASSNTGVATVSGDGVITAVEPGTVEITVGLGDASGTVSVVVSEPPPGPAEAAPVPTQDAADVISLFSNVYTNVPVDTWSADWDVADVSDIQVAGDDVRLYRNLSFAGVEFTSNPIDASGMTHFSMDIWTPDDTNPPAALRIKLVDFGADGVFGGGDDSEAEPAFTASSTPGIASNQWVTLDIPLSQFAGLSSTGAVAQLILSGDPNTVYVDNVFFYRGDGGGTSEPTTAAPTPTQNASEVTSLFSNAYTDVTVDTWSASWDNADVADVMVAGDDVKLYTNMNVAGIEFVSAPVDASGHTHFRMDVWTPDDTNPPAAFRIKLVDFGADGAFGGGDDSEHEVSLDASTSPALVSGQWSQLDFDLSAWTGLASRAALAQLIISGDPNTVYVDNVYFYGSSGTGSGGATEPTSAAPMPTQDASEVTSLFSNAYADVTVDTWSASWDNADVADVTVAGDDVKLYTNMSVAGIEFVAAPVDASGHTHFRMDVWTPDDTNPPAAFRIKLVDFGADGAFGGGDDSEHEVALDASTSPALVSGQWNQLDFDLSAWTGLASRAALAQLILSGDPNTVYVDNVYFYGSSGAGGGGATEPTTAAPTPTYDAGDTISLFSDAFTDVTVDTWSTSWDNADVADVTVAGDNVKLYTNLVVAGVEAVSSPIDASSMTHFRMDIWTPDDVTNAAFRVKLVDFGADAAFGGGDDVEHELTFTATSSPALVQGTWLTLDLPLSEFTNLTTRSALAQFIFSGDLPTVYIDNVLFHR